MKTKNNIIQYHTHSGLGHPHFIQHLVVPENAIQVLGHGFDTHSHAVEMLKREGWQQASGTCWERECPETETISIDGHTMFLCIHPNSVRIERNCSDPEEPGKYATVHIDGHFAGYPDNDITVTECCQRYVGRVFVHGGATATGIKTPEGLRIALKELAARYYTMFGRCMHASSYPTSGVEYRGGGSMLDAVAEARHIEAAIHTYQKQQNQH